MKAFTYGKRLNRSNSPHLTIRDRIKKLEEKKNLRRTLKLLYERKSTSVCCDRDPLVLKRGDELHSTGMVKYPFYFWHYEEDNAEIQDAWFRRRGSHGHFNYWMSKEEQMAKYGKISISLMDELEFERKRKLMESQSKHLRKNSD